MQKHIVNYMTPNYNHQHLQRVQLSPVSSVNMLQFTVLPRLSAFGKESLDDLADIAMSDQNNGLSLRLGLNFFYEFSCALGHRSRRLDIVFTIFPMCLARILCPAEVVIGVRLKLIVTVSTLAQHNVRYRSRNIDS